MSRHITLPQDQSIDTIEWRPVPGFGGYSISEYGHLRNDQRGSLMAPYIAPTGYLRYTLGTARRRYAHRLVAEAFLSPCPRGKHDAAHWDGNKRNNHYSNLRWATRRKNIHDKWRHGRMARGEGINTAKITEDIVRVIRASYVRGSKTHGQRALGEQYGLTQASVGCIVRRVNWKHV